MKWRIIVYKCSFCGELIGVACDEKLRYYDDTDMMEHCSECMATTDDFDKVKEVEVEAETLPEAIDKAIRGLMSD